MITSANPEIQPSQLTVFSGPKNASTHMCIMDTSRIQRLYHDCILYTLVQGHQALTREITRRKPLKQRVISYTKSSFLTSIINPWYKKGECRDAWSHWLEVCKRKKEKGTYRPKNNNEILRNRSWVEILKKIFLWSDDCHHDNYEPATSRQMGIPNPTDAKDWNVTRFVNTSSPSVSCCIVRANSSV